MIYFDKVILLTTVFLLSISSLTIFSEEKADSEESPEKVEKSSDEESNKASDPEKIKLDIKNGEIPGFKIDLKKKEVRMEAEICLTSGLLEYLVCLPQTFEHEAIFVTETKPQLLHACLLMIGAEPTHIMKEGYSWWSAIKKRPKSRLQINVEWKDKTGKNHKVPMQKLLLKRDVAKDAKKEEKYAEDEWYFNGSFFYEGRYVASQDASVVAVQTMASSVIQYGIDTGNPYDEGGNFGFEINNKLCPPYGTKVNIVFSPMKEKKHKETKEEKDQKKGNQKGSDKKTEEK